MTCAFTTCIPSLVSFFHHYRPQTKLLEGNVFTGVCDSVHGGDACSGGCLLPGGCLVETPSTATAACGTLPHPTGMHSCSSILSVIPPCFRSFLRTFIVGSWESLFSLNLKGSFSLSSGLGETFMFAVSESIIYWRCHIRSYHHSVWTSLSTVWIAVKPSESTSVEGDTTRRRSEFKIRDCKNKVQFHWKLGQKRKFRSKSFSKVYVVLTKRVFWVSILKVTWNEICVLSLMQMKLYLIFIKLVLELGSRSRRITPPALVRAATFRLCVQILFHARWENRMPGLFWPPPNPFILRRHTLNQNAKAQCDKKCKITQNRVFLAKNTPRPERGLMEDFVYGSGVWIPSHYSCAYWSRLQGDERCKRNCSL